ncbi:MAG: cation diffusion facilitator family transporter [Phycisphaerales bacterium]|nr:cation diffusion facilitator family transporter [Phycisphaerales bacterium]
MAAATSTSTSATNAATSGRVLRRRTLIGLVVSLALAAGKLVAGLLGHSSALVADAVESAADACGSLIVWQALRVAAKPPDANHPYGYGKAEHVAALVVGLLLILAAGLIVIEAARMLFITHEAPKAWTLWVLLGVILTKETLFRWLLGAADRHRSDSVRADAWHHRADAITSAAALLGVTIAIWGPRWFAMPKLVYADEVAALFASGIIVLTALSVLRPALRHLLDAAPHDTLDQVRRIAQAVPGVRLVEKVTGRQAGPGCLVDMHLHVDPAMSVHDAHALAGRVKAEIRAGLPEVSHVLIHIEPAEDDSNKE